MHTARQLRLGQFSVRVADAQTDASRWLDWGPQDRLGIIVDRPLGALGASLAIQLATAAFYGLKGESRRRRPMYADNYLFHVGGPWGDFSAFDFWPARREIRLPPDPAAVLVAVNDRAITHLLVPDGKPREATFGFKEADSAEDRLKLCLAYGRDGNASPYDVTIVTRSPEALANAAEALDMRPALDLPANPDLLSLPGYARDAEDWRSRVISRLDEVPQPERDRSGLRIAAAVATSFLEERYRICTPEWALGRLCGDVA